MLVFLSEYLTGGASSANADAQPSLAAEGAAMIRALAADAVAVPGWQVVVTWDAFIEPFGIPGVEVCLVRTCDEERDHFRRLAAVADATFVIAPEFGRLLETRVRMIAEAGGHSAGATPEAIALCGDKLALAEHLTRCGISTVQTRRCDFGELDASLARLSGEGFVVKPRFGAGAIGLFRVRNRSELAAARQGYAGDHPFGEPLIQPFVQGVSLSVSGIVSASGIELLPIARQRIMGDRRFVYGGGLIPIATGQEEAITDVATRTLASVPGLRGYVGIDFLLPESVVGFGPPVVVEINPRLTTSYLGYRLLSLDNLAERLLTSDSPRPAIGWRAGQVEFSPNGKATLRPAAQQPLPPHGRQ